MSHLCAIRQKNRCGLASAPTNVCATWCRIAHVRKFLLLALSFLGLFDSLYLWWVYTSPSHPLVCLGTGCDVVRASSYSHVWGLPVPLYGVALYGALVLLAFAETLGGRVLFTPIRYLMLLVSAGGFAVSLVLSGLEAFVIHAWCAWCVLSAITVTLIAALALWRVTRPPEPVTGQAALASVRWQFGLFVVALLVGIPAFAYLARSGELPLPKPKPAAVVAAHLVRPDSYSTGDPNSPVTVVEFADFQCPMCRLAQQTVENILSQYGSRIRFVFRQFPEKTIHPYAEKAAEASECAGEQGKFWQAEKLFYQKQSDLRVPALEGYAAQLGLNTQQFDECLTSGRMKSRVQQDIADGKALGVVGTPTFFVGRQEILGAPDPEYFSRLITEQLAASVQSPSPAAGAPATSTSPAKSTSTSPSGNASLNASSASLGAGEPLGSNTFSQLQAQSALACNPDEANLESPTLIRTAEAEELFKAKAVFVDVRSAKKFAEGHIPGAVNIPVEEIGQEGSKLPKNRTLVFYQGGEQGGSPADVCAFSRAAARSVLAQGFNKALVKVYQDGLKGWLDAGLPASR